MSPMQHVSTSRLSRPSAKVLDDSLRAEGYNGPPINYGWGGSQRAGLVNNPQAVSRAVNKRIALETMRDNGVPTLLVDPEQEHTWPIVGRPDMHRKGRHLYLCRDQAQYVRALARPRNGPTHWQRYLEGDGVREFRVHIVYGQSVKISGKSGGGNHSSGATFAHPGEFTHKATLRAVAKHAVASLGLDFGAVDLIWDGSPWVLEVNTAPRLTDPTSDTLARYVRALLVTPTRRE